MKHSAMLTVASLLSILLTTGIIWVIAAIYLFGFLVKYKFESGVVTCLWFGGMSCGKTIWTHLRVFKATS
jgi:hypothetical protein